MKTVLKRTPRSSISLLLFTAIVSSVGYLARVTEFSPVYILIPALSLLMLSVSRWRRGIFLSPDLFLTLSLLLYVIFLNAGNYANGSFLNLVTGLFSYIAIRLYAGMLSTDRIVVTFNFATKVVILLLSIDTTIRLLAPAPPTPDYIDRIYMAQEGFRYLYKFGGFMFADSNSTGLVALVFLFTSIEVNKNGRLGMQDYLLGAISIASLSYSVYLTIIVFLIYSLLRRRITKSNIGIKFFLIAAGIPFLSLTLESIIGNQSLNSKFFIATISQQYVANTDLQTLIFGAGAGQAIEVLGIFTHNLLLTYFIELGLFGLTIIILFFTYVARKSDGITVLAVLLASMSYFLYLGTPFLFVAFALVRTIKQKRRGDKEELERDCAQLGSGLIANK